MKVETAPVRLADYRAPEFLIDTVKLDIRLDPEKTKVTRCWLCAGTARAPAR